MSSKCGAKTVLIEAYGLPGGMAVIGEVQPFMISGTREKPLDGPIYTQWKEAMLNYFPKADQTKYQKATDRNENSIQSRYKARNARAPRIFYSELLKSRRAEKYRSGNY